METNVVLAWYLTGGTRGCQKMTFTADMEKGKTMNKWIKYNDVVALLKAHAQDGDNLTLIGDETAEALENIPGIDIVHCGECRYNHNGTCWFTEWVRNINDFCSYGERKDQ